MSVSLIIEQIVLEWAYRVNDGMPDIKNPTHLKELSIILSEMGLSSIKTELIENLITEKGKTPEEIKEEDKSFTNPILNKKVTYKDKQGKDKEGIVGNLLRQPEGTPARDAAEKVLPPEGSPERDALNKDLGGEGKPQGTEEPTDKKGDGETGGAPKEDPIQKAAPMFDPKLDPAMGVRLDKEKETQAQIAKDAEDANKEAEKKIEPEKKEGEFNPIPAQDVQKEIPNADPDTFSSPSDIPDGVEPEDLNKFNTDISKVQQIVADAKAKGEKAPNINLCQITVPGTNLYCDDNLGIPRSEMPQFKGKAQPDSRAANMPVDKDGEVDTEPVFKEMLNQKNIKVTQTEVPADKLKATQSELVGAKVVGMMGALEENPQHEKITAPIYVSRDGYVIDGHHRWAAIAAYNAKNPEKQIPMKVQVIDMDIKDAIPMCNTFAEDMGIAAKKADANKETPSEEEPKKATSLAGGLTQKIKDKISKWHKEEKEFFEKGYYKAGSEPRRKIAQAIKDKAKGAWKAIKHGAQHEIAEFKEAGKGVSKFFKGEKLNDHEKNAVKSVGIKIATTAIFGAALGGLSHGAAAFAKHVAVEFVPHVIGETILKGTARAALFADADGEAEMDANMERFAELIAKGLEDMDISAEQMEEYIDSYNQKKEKGETDIETPQIKEELLPIIDKMIGQIIEGFIDETNPIKKANDVLNQYVKNTETNRDIKVASALKYKNSQNKGKLQAYKAAIALLKKAGISDKELGKEKQPKEIPGQWLGFRKTKELEPAVPKSSKSITIPKEKERTETKNPHKKNGDEGQTMAELKPEEIDNIIEKYVNTGEATPDEMRPLQKGYANQDMAETYSDEDYYSKENGGRKHSTLVREEPYKIDNKTRKLLRDSGFPEKYIKFLERCINTQVKNKKPAVTELIAQGGAGQIQSQFGEVMAMAFMSIRDPQMRRKFADIINGEIKKSAEEFGGGKQSPVATIDWVEASLTHAEAFDSAMDEKYGKGQWRFEGAAWDIKGDIEALGLDYKNKGFSTDVMLRVQPLDKKGNPKGPARAQKNSLKKDENIFFFNGSINEVNNFLLNFLDEKERRKVRAYEAIATKAGASNKNAEDRAAALAAAERITGLKGAKAVAALKQITADIRDKAFNAAPSHVKEAVSKVRNFGANQTASAEKLIKGAKTDIKNPNNVIDNAKNIDSGDKEFAKFAYKTVKDCKASGAKDITLCIRQKLSAAGEETGDDRVCKVAVMATKVAIASGDTNAEKALNKHYNLAVEAGNALMTVLPESPELMGGLMQKLADAFPMKTCIDGEEFMCIDGMKVTQKTLQTVFGVSSYEELQKGMKLKRLPNGETILVYGAKTKDGQDIPIGVVGARQKGKGYEGTVGFEISCSDDFALAVAEANKKNGDTSQSNEKARVSIGKRVANRKAKAGIKK